MFYAINVAWTVDEKKVLSKKEGPVPRNYLDLKEIRVKIRAKNCLRVHFDQLLESIWNYSTFIMKINRMF